MNIMKNVLQRFTHAAMLLFLAMSMAGCHGNNSDKKRVAAAISTLNNPWFVFLGKPQNNPAEGTSRR